MADLLNDRPPTYPEIAYMAMLQIPPGSMLRHRAQACLSELRDLIALERGVSGEEVQTQFEDAIAAMMHGSPHTHDLSEK